ncbi:MAG: hypothetical protein ABI703_05710 [Gemmatimonadales bacterium]
MPAIFRSPARVLLLLTLACGGGRAPDTVPDPDSGDQPRVRIENRASLDMDIYVLRNDGERIRLGFVPGGEKATFALPATVTSGASTIRFEAQPVRRGGEPVVSEIFGVHTGEAIAWSIPPQ